MFTGLYTNISDLHIFNKKTKFGDEKNMRKQTSDKNRKWDAEKLKQTQLKKKQINQNQNQNKPDKTHGQDKNTPNAKIKSKILWLLLLQTEFWSSQG